MFDVIATAWGRSWSRWGRLAVVAGLAGVGGLRGGTAESARELADKTLVVWVDLADTVQRGGGALSVMEGEDFDAVVFGERQPGRWMAGSDFFRRTLSAEAQAAIPVEQAGPGTLVQVAIVYAGDTVTVYRDGARWSEHRVTAPRVFDEDWYAVLGVRYLGQGGPIGFLGGSVEEARLYDRALDAATLAALSPAPALEPASTPAPLAQWTFEDGTARDVRGWFPPAALHGGASISGGRLRLDGRTGYAVARRVAGSAGSQLMFYKARTTGNMWDTWLYQHEGTYHLFHLAGPMGGWDGIAMATSTDGVHWRERGKVLGRAEGVTWLGTGATWASPNFVRDRKFYLNFSEWRGDRQTIFFAESTNLVDWTRLGPEREFKPDPRWYRADGGNDGRWDCIYPVPRPGGGLFGYWTANPREFVGFGFGETLDGVTWRALEPPRIEWGDVPPPGGCEAGAVEKLGASYYMMLGAGLKGEHGMFTLVADQPAGPFRPARRNLALLTSRGHGNTYFARFFPTPDGVLVNHHAIARNGEVSMGTLKRAVLDAGGTLRLGWWSGNERLREEPVAVTLPAAVPGQARGAMEVEWLEPEFDLRRGLILEGVLRLPAPASAVAPGARAAEAEPTGFYIAHGKDTGTGIRVSAGGITEFGSLRADGTGFRVENRIDREWAFGGTARFRLLVKGSLLEFYLDDLLMQCYSLPRRAAGRIGVFGGGSAPVVSALRAWHPGP